MKIICIKDFDHFKKEEILQCVRLLKLVHGLDAGYWIKRNDEQISQKVHATPDQFAEHFKIITA